MYFAPGIPAAIRRPRATGTCASVARCGARTARQLLELGDARDSLRIGGVAREDVSQKRSIPPTFHKICQPFLGGRRGQVGRKKIGDASKPAEQNQVRYTVRVGGREQNAHGGALGESDQRGTLRADRIHDRADIINTLIERGYVGQPVREALPSFVEGDDPGELGQPAKNLRVARQLMLIVDMRDDAGDQDYVDRPVTHHLVGDAEIATLRILRLGQS